MTYEQLERLKEWVRAEIRFALRDGLNERIEVNEAEEALDEALSGVVGVESYWAEDGYGCTMNEEEGLRGTNGCIAEDEE